MARKPAARWGAPLSRPLVLRDGTRLETLADARALILRLRPSNQEPAAWQKAAALLIVAAEHGGNIEAATEQLFDMLFMHNKIRLQ